MHLRGQQNLGVRKIYGPTKVSYTEGAQRLNVTSDRKNINTFKRLELKYTRSMHMQQTRHYSQKLMETESFYNKEAGNLNVTALQNVERMAEMLGKENEANAQKNRKTCIFKMKNDRSQMVGDQKVFGVNNDQTVKENWHLIKKEEKNK